MIAHRFPRSRRRVATSTAALLAALALPVLAAPRVHPGLQEDGRLSEVDFPVPEDMDAILGEGFVVDGVTITPADLKRGIVVGAAGRQILESAKLQIFIDEELERQKAEGVDLAKYEVTQADVQEAIAEADELVKKEFPGDPVIQTSRDLFAMPEGMWFDQIKQTQQFDAIFLPEDPREYPATTVAALNQSQPEFHQKLVQGHEEREALAKEKGEEVQIDKSGQAMFRQLMRQIVIAALNGSAEIKTFNDGLPPEVALEVNGHPIKTEDIWRQVRWKVGEGDVAEARAWFERTTAVRNALKEADAYMTDEEYEQAYHDHTAPYASSPFNMEAVATSFKKFPSAEHYRAHFRLLESYRRMIADEITDENLQAHVNGRAGSLLGLAKVNVDVILVPAYDFRLGLFPEGGWEKAGERAVECIQALANGMPWDEAIETYSGWYEPPLGKSQANNAATLSKNKGRFGLKNRNELMQQLGESDWSTFLYGGSVTDYIFFDLEVGKPSQPLRGQHGYYVAKVKQRTAPVTPINLKPDGHRNLVEQDYVNTRFDAYVAQAVPGE
jgi:hypothetical protein